MGHESAPESQETRQYELITDEQMEALKNPDNTHVIMQHSDLENTYHFVEACNDEKAEAVKAKGPRYGGGLVVYSKEEAMQKYLFRTEKGAQE